jgi:signal transduction histidine kinase
LRAKPLGKIYKILMCGVMNRPASDSTEVWLFSLPPTPRQARITLASSISLLAGLGVSAPFADTPLPRIDAFIPTLEGAIILTDLITSVLLFSQSWISHSRALLALACGYLFTALIVIPHVLTFPGAFSPTGLLGAGVQTAGWLYIFWHFGLPAAIVIYAYLKDEKLDISTSKTATPYAVGWSAAIVVSVVCALTLLVTTGEPILPPVFLDRLHIAPLAHYVLILNVLVSAAALVILWSRRRSVLDQWLMVVILALISELATNGLLISARFTVGWYVSRLFAIVTSTIVLAVLLEETMVLYGRMARSNAALLRERDNRLMNLEALAAAIRHEVRQPLMANIANAEALKLYLKNAPPELDEARLVAEEIITESHRINEMLDNIGDLFGNTKREPSPVDVNDLALDALGILDKELKDHKVASRVELASELPPVMGHSGQLREVIINLIQNAIDAMEAVDAERRELHVKTERYGGDKIHIIIRDTGPGIDPKKSDEIFEAFFTTKSHGMGLGLAICRMIIERHGGQLSVSPANPHGAVFQMMFPQSTNPGFKSLARRRLAYCR